MSGDICLPSLNSGAAKYRKPTLEEKTNGRDLSRPCRALTAQVAPPTPWLSHGEHAHHQLAVLDEHRVDQLARRVQIALLNRFEQLIMQFDVAVQALRVDRGAHLPDRFQHARLVAQEFQNLAAQRLVDRTRQIVVEVEQLVDRFAALVFLRVFAGRVEDGMEIGPICRVYLSNTHSIAKPSNVRISA